MRITPGKAASRDRLKALVIALAFHAGILLIPLEAYRDQHTRKLQILDLHFLPAQEVSPPKIFSRTLSPRVSPLAKALEPEVAEVEPPEVWPASAEEVPTESAPIATYRSDALIARTSPHPGLSPASAFSGFARQGKAINLASPSAGKTRIPAPLSAPVPFELAPDPPGVQQVNGGEKQPAIEDALQPEIDPKSETFPSIGNDVKNESTPIPYAIENPAPVYPALKGVASVTRLHASTAPRIQPETAVPFQPSTALAAETTSAVVPAWSEVPWDPLPLDIPRASTVKEYRPVVAPVPEIILVNYDLETQPEVGVPPLDPVFLSSPLPLGKFGQLVPGKRPASARSDDMIKDMDAAAEGDTPASVADTSQPVMQSVVPVESIVPVKSPAVPPPMASPPIAAAPKEHSGSLVQGTKTSDKDILALLSARIAAQKTYPEAAKRRNAEGTVKVSVRIGKDGTLKASKIVGRSGSAVLDRAASDLVEELFPVDLLPADEMEVVVTIEYRLAR